MRVKTKKQICKKELQALLNVNDYNKLFLNLKNYIYRLWACDQLTDSGYDEITLALSTSFVNNKLINNPVSQIVKDTCENCKYRTKDWFCEQCDAYCHDLDLEYEGCDWNEDD